MPRRLWLGSNSLRILRFVDQHPKGVAAVEVAEHMSWTKPKATGALNRLRVLRYLVGPPSQQRPPFVPKGTPGLYKTTALGRELLERPAQEARPLRPTKPPIPPKPRREWPPVGWKDEARGLVVSEAQLRLLRVIAKVTDRLGMPPTLRELLRELGNASLNGTHEVLGRLRRKGLIIRDDMLSRTTMLTELGREVLARSREKPIHIGDGRWLLERNPTVYFVAIVQCAACGASRAGDGHCPVCDPWVSTSKASRCP